MRKLILAAALAAIAAPALSQPRPHAPPPRDDLARALPNPNEVERMGEAIARVADALMEVDVGPMADAIDPARRYGLRRGPATLGDLASRRDPYARERMHGEIAGAAAGLGAATRELAILAPMLRDSFLDATRRMDAAMRDSRPRRERYEDRDEDGGPDGR
ncbi:MAG: hypothetical protein ACJ8DZ_12935 [Allosphingosinicella sp.]